MTAHSEENNHAQRWPAPAIAAILASTSIGLISVVLTLGLAIFSYYNSNKDGSATRREADVRELLDTKSRLTVAEGKVDTLLRENGDLKADVKVLENDMKVVKMAQHLQ